MVRVGRGRRRLAGALLVALTLAAACDPDRGPDETATEPPLGGTGYVEGGTVIFGAAEQPTTLNAGHRDGNLPVNELLFSAVLSPLWRITPEYRYEPLLLDGEPEIGADPFTVTYTLKPDLQWSDGEPLTADDIVFTHEMIVEHELDVPSARGHALVRATRVMGDRKVRFEFSQPFSGWRGMFSEPRAAILPRHVLGDRDFGQAWHERINVASGPFEFDTWQRGQQLVLKRNESYWGAPATLDEVIITFHSDAGERLEALTRGDIDIAEPPADVAARRALDATDDTEYDIAHGTAWEHLDLNTDRPPVDKTFVRTAIARAIDREAIVAELARPLVSDSQVLNNVLLLGDMPAFADHWSAIIGYDPQAAEDLLTSNGCDRPGDVYVCDGVPLELEYLTTSDVDARITQFDLIREDLAAVGIRLIPRLISSEAAAGDPGEDWHLFSHARQGSTNTTDAAAAWRCDAPPRSNRPGYCSEAAEGLLQAAARIVETAQRDRLWNEADAVIARDVPTIPLYQRPTLLAWNARIDGPRHNATAWGPLWNVGAWKLSQ